MMSDKSKSALIRPLDDALIGSLAVAIAPTADTTDSISDVRARLMRQIDQQPRPARFVTIRSDDDVIWIEISPKVEKKVLHIDRERGIETYLLRMHPGATVGTHAHEADEHCVVLEGEVLIDNQHLQAGDYHFAPKGSVHNLATTRNGTLLMLQSALAA